MIALAILFALTVILPPLGFGPPMYRGSRAKNGVLYVLAPPRGGLEEKASEAHEVIEWWCAWVAGCLVALPVAWFFPEGLAERFGITLPNWLLASLAVLIAAVAGNALTRKLTTHFDYVGHNVGAMIRGNREAEITRMIERGDQRGMTRADVSRRLKRWEWVANLALALFIRRYP